MSTDQGRPAEPEPVNDTVPLDLGAGDTAPLDLGAGDTAPLDLGAGDTAPLDLGDQAYAQPTTEPEAPFTTDFVLPPAPAAETAPATTTVPEVTGRPAPRVGTVVWGLILAVIGVGVIAAAAGARFDVELVSITLLALAGVGLLVGSIATSMRRRRS